MGSVNWWGASDDQSDEGKHRWAESPIAATAPSDVRRDPLLLDQNLKIVAAQFAAGSGLPLTSAPSARSISMGSRSSPGSLQSEVRGDCAVALEDAVGVRALPAGGDVGAEGLGRRPERHAPSCRPASARSKLRARQTLRRAPRPSSRAGRRPGRGAPRAARRAVARPVRAGGRRRADARDGALADAADVGRLGARLGGATGCARTSSSRRRGGSSGTRSRRRPGSTRTRIRGCRSGRSGRCSRSSTGAWASRGCAAWPRIWVAAATGGSGAAGSAVQHGSAPRGAVRPLRAAPAGDGARLGAWGGRGWGGAGASGDGAGRPSCGGGCARGSACRIRPSGSRAPARGCGRSPGSSSCRRACRCSG